MKKIVYFLLILLFIISCQRKEVIKTHGISYLEKREKLIYINKSNKNDTIDIFGINRCIFATNFPVDKKYSNYDKVLDSYTEITKDFSDDEKNKIFHGNATKYYRL